MLIHDFTEEPTMNPALVDEAFYRQALIILKSTKMLEKMLAHYRQSSSSAPARDVDYSEGLSQIYGRGTTTGPMLAMDMDSTGPMLAQRDAAEGPMLDNSKAVSAPAVADPDVIPPDQESLYREMRELRQMVNQLKEEAKAREQLRAKDEEERDKESEILEAAGREYSLRPPFTFGMDLTVDYSYNDYDVIRQMSFQSANQLTYHANHTISNSLSLESGVRPNLSVGATVPFIYKYDKVDTADSKDVTNLGDMSIRAKYQPLKSGRGYPSPIFQTSFTFPTGKSLYDINPATELATGSGNYRIAQSVSVSIPFDPVNAFANVSYTHRIKIDDIGQRRSGRILESVDAGDSIGVSLGFGYAVSYRMSLSLGLSTSYYFSTDYYWLVSGGLEGPQREKTSTGDSVSASLDLNTSWRVTPGRTVIIGIGKGLTTANPGFSLSVRLPVSFDLR